MFPLRSRPVRRAAAVLLTAGALLAGVVLTSAPAHAAVLFADDFELPTRNVWIASPGFSVVTEDGSKVYQQSSTINFPYAMAGAGSNNGTSVTARVKPTSALGSAGLVALAGKLMDPNNYYFIGFHGPRVELGQLTGGRFVSLASAPYSVSLGTWYQFTLGFPAAGTVTGSVSRPGAAAVNLTGTDPGGFRIGDKVGFTTQSASASFDDLVLSDGTPTPPTPSAPPACPVAIAMKIGVDFGTGFNATVTFKNLTTAPITPTWTMTWRFTDGQVMQGMFNANGTQRGAVVTVQPFVWFPVVQPGATSSPPFGFSASGPGTGHPPADVTFNGAPCPLTFS